MGCARENRTNPALQTAQGLLLCLGSGGGGGGEVDVFGGARATVWAAFEYGANCAIPSFTFYTLLPPGLASELKDAALKYTKVPQYLLKPGSAFLFKAEKNKSDCVCSQSIGGVKGFVKGRLLAAWKEGTKWTFPKALLGPRGMTSVWLSNSCLFCSQCPDHPCQVSPASLAPRVCLLPHPHPNPRELT